MDVYCVEWVRKGASFEEDTNYDYVLANSTRQAAGDTKFKHVSVVTVRKVGEEEAKRAIENGWVARDRENEAH